MTLKLTTRGYAVAEAIRDRVEFKTHGALKSVAGRSAAFLGPGRLDQNERELFYAHEPTYVVLSYSTPIAWWSQTYGWHVVAQKFSVTTSKHQGKLYLIPRATEQTWACCTSSIGPACEHKAGGTT